LKAFFKIIIILSVICRNAAYAQYDTLKINALLDSAQEKQYVDLEAQKRFSEEALRLSERADYKKGIATACYEIGIYHYDKGNYNEAFSFMIRCHKISKDNGLINIELKALNGLGLVFTDKFEPKKAIQYFNEGIDKALKSGNERALINFYTNIANAYNHLEKYDKSLEIQFKTLSLLQKANKPLNLALLYNNIGNTYKYKGSYNRSLPYYLKSQHLLDSINDQSYTPTVMCNIAECYDLGKDFAKAEQTYKKAESVSKEMNNIKILNHVYFKIAGFYQNNKKYKEANDYLHLYIDSNQSIFSVEKEEIQKELETKYKTEQKEQENVILQKENTLSAEKIRQQKIFSYFIIFCLVLAIGLIFFIFRSYRIKKRANLLITKQKQEVEEQKLLVEEKNHVIEEKQKEIIDSINYAKRIQVALLANKEILDSNLGPENYFVYFKPKDIVSGDFYWAASTGSATDGKFYLAVCDSTGHGVPGAFMSLLNIGFLSEAIKEKNITQPNAVFNYVRQRLIESISKEEQQDGMDGILLCIDKATRTVTYAAANNSPVIVSNGTMTQLPADKMPVGKGETDKAFSLHTVECHKGDMLYLYTDGYADQFGGPKGKKFKYKPLNELLFSVYSKNPGLQQETLADTFNDWIGRLEQVDDVLIIGLKL
jgi:serine phosphatase RsbU (regulator of sigma subunit)